MIMLNENISKAKMLEFVNASKVTLFKVPNMLYFQIHRLMKI